MDGTQTVGGGARPGAAPVPSRTQAATRHGELPHRDAEGGSETGDSWQMTIPRLTGEQGSHSSLTSLKIGGFAGHILAHDGPLFNYGLLGAVAGFGRERLH